jgi:2',3'-cyclic-nucleotide 2'-phosphodiesterase (5'-nucleotidase family)
MILLQRLHMTKRSQPMSFESPLPAPRPVSLSRRRMLALLAGTAIAPMMPRAARAADKADFKIIILSDLHSAYERLPHMLAAIEASVADAGAPVLIAINGDLFEAGNVVATRSKGSVDWAFVGRLTKLAPVVLNIGNHEPDLEPDLADVVARARALGVTVLSNIIDARTGQPYAPASAEITLGARKLTIAGIAVNAINTYPKAIRPTLTIPDPVAWSSEHLPALLTGTDFNLVLSHAGVTPDKRILPLLPDGTLLVGGHDHLVFSHEQGATRYVHTGSWSRGFAVAAITGKEIQLERHEIALDAPKDPQLAGLVEAALAAHLTDAERAVVAHAAHAYGLDEAGREVARLIAKAHGADVGLVGHTTFGTGFPAGEISRYAFDSVVRFEGKLMIAEMDGADLARIFAVANQDREMPLAERMGDFVYANPVEPVPGRTYRVVANDWTVINRKSYLGREDLAFAPLPDALLKPTVLAGLKG